MVGGGAAGAAAVEALRQHGFGGRIVLVSREEQRPYDRPNLSKDYLAGTAGADWLPLRPASFYERHGIELLTAEVLRLDATTRRLELDDGSVFVPDAVLIATGGVPHALDTPGVDLPGVHTLRSWSDCDAVIASLEGAAHAVVVGASFIAMEGAASLRERGLDVTVVAPDEVPLERQLGAAIGGFLRRRHEEHGVRFLLGHTVARFAGEGHVHEIVLDDGARLAADVVLVGVGVRPATGFVENATVGADGGLDVDAELRVNDHGVWAAGDVARYPESTRRRPGAHRALAPGGTARPSRRRFDGRPRRALRRRAGLLDAAVRPATALRGRGRRLGRHRRARRSARWRLHRRLRAGRSR